MFVLHTSEYERPFRYFPFFFFLMDKRAFRHSRRFAHRYYRDVHEIYIYIFFKSFHMITHVEEEITSEATVRAMKRCFGRSATLANILFGTTIEGCLLSRFTGGVLLFLLSHLLSERLDTAEAAKTKAFSFPY